MEKTYSAITKSVEVDFNAPTARASLNMAMKFAERCIRKNIGVQILCGNEIVWSSQDYKG